MTHRIRLHPDVAGDLAAIADMITAYAGPQAALRRLTEIEQVNIEAGTDWYVSFNAAGWTGVDGAFRFLPNGRSERSLAVIAVHSMLEYPLWYGPFQITAIWCLVFLVRRSHVDGIQAGHGWPIWPP